MFKQRAFVTDEDIRSIQSFRDQTLIAIKAPSGTTLAVPYPENTAETDQGRYQIFLKSEDGPVEIYLVSSPRDGDDSDAGEAEEQAQCGAEGEGDAGFLRLSPPMEQSNAVPDFFEGDQNAGFSDFYRADFTTSLQA